jgi:hypothetical protein
MWDADARVWPRAGRPGNVWIVRLLPRFNLKRQVWPGGPQVGEVIEAQLSPRSSVSAGAQLSGTPEQAPEHDAVAVDLLLLLR